MSSEVLLCGPGLEQTTISEIKAVFKKFGPVTKIIYINENELSFCFIHYLYNNDATKAVSHYHQNKLYFKNTTHNSVTVNLTSEFHHLIDPKLIPKKPVETKKSHQHSLGHSQRSRSPHATSRNQSSEHKPRSTSKSSKSYLLKRSRSPRQSRSPKRVRANLDREKAKEANHYVKKEKNSFYNVLTENKSLENQKMAPKFCRGSKELSSYSMKENPDTLGPLNSFLISKTEMKCMNKKNLQSTVIQEPSPHNKIDRFNVANADDSWSSGSAGSPCKSEKKNIVPNEDSFREISGNL